MQPASVTWVVLVSLTALASACAGLDHGVYAKAHARYRIGELPPSWHMLRLQGNDVAFMSTDSPHTLAINATCENHDDPSLEVLTRHLLIGFTECGAVDQSKETLDGREALRTHVVARLDGVPVELLLVVMKKDRCVYDFTYLSPVGRVEERVAVFEQILLNFKTVSRT